MKTLSLLSLLAIAGTAGTAHAAEAATDAAASCVSLSTDQQIVRAGASENVLLRNADQHYIVHFQDSCSSAARSSKLAFATPGRDGQLCGGGVSSLRTSSQKCVVSTLEPITAEQFATRARARR